jgi:hypothetical protein
VNCDPAEVRACTRGVSNDQWPKNRGVAYLAALHACLDALRGTVSTETARQAFIAAAREVGILIGEAPLRGSRRTTWRPKLGGLIAAALFVLKGKSAVTAREYSSGYTGIPVNY